MKSVLIVDDEPVDRFITEYTIRLTAKDWQITSLPTAMQALTHLNYSLAHNGKVPDIILLDLLMPVMSGIEFLQNLKEEHDVHKGLRPRIIVLTISGNPLLHRQALALGAEKILPKPVKPQDLLACFR